MARVQFTGNLRRHVRTPAEEVEAMTVGDALARYFDRHPTARGYVLDDQGAVRKRMLVLVDGRPIRDRARLSDTLRPESEVFVFQALSGG
jgi:sulfur-carrier protein